MLADVSQEREPSWQLFAGIKLVARGADYFSEEVSDSLPG